MLEAGPGIGAANPIRVGVELKPVVGPWGPEPQMAGHGHLK